MDKALAWSFQEGENRWIRHRDATAEWMYAWIDFDEGFWHIDTPEGEVQRGYFATFKGDIAACMGHIDNILKERGVKLVGGLPKDLEHMKKGYDKKVTGKSSTMSEEEEEKDWHPSLQMAFQAGKSGAALSLTKEAQETVNDLTKAMLKQALGDHYETFVDTPLGGAILSFGAPFVLHFMTYQAPYLFMGREEQVRAACQLAMTAQTYEHMQPVLVYFKEAMGGLADVGKQVIEAKLLSTDFDPLEGIRAKEKVKATAATK